MATVQPDKLVFYHPCDSLVDSSGYTWTNGEDWGLGFIREGVFVDGLNNNAFSSSGSTPSFNNMSLETVYGNNDGETRVTCTFWAKGLGGSTGDYVSVGFYNYPPPDRVIQQLDLRGDGRVRLSVQADDAPADSATIFTWSGVVDTTDDWRCYALDFEQSGSHWVLHHSIGCQLWTNEGQQDLIEGTGNGDFQASNEAYARILLKNSGAESGVLIDDVSYWRGATLFTQEELLNVFSGCTHHARVDLFIGGPDSISVSGDLFIHGRTDHPASGDMFINGHAQLSGSGDLFIHGRDTTSGSMPLCINGTYTMPAPEDGELRIVHRLTKTGDYDPQLISAFDTPPVSVNIEVWGIGDGQNTQIAISNSGCYAIGDTGRWGWSTANLPFTSEHQKYHYYFMMTSNEGEKQYGEFFITVPERGRWSHPD